MTENLHTDVTQVINLEGIPDDKDENKPRDLTLNLTIPIGDQGSVSIASTGYTSDSVVHFDGRLKIDCQTTDIEQVINLIRSFTSKLSVRPANG